MTDNLSKIIDKIRKLMALANNNDSEAQAAFAAAKVQELLAQHNLTQAQVMQEQTKVGFDAIQTKSEAWQRNLRGAVARFYFCKYFYDQRKENKGKYNQYYDLHVYVGEQHNVVVAQAMSEYLINTGVRLATDYAKMRYLEKSMFSKNKHDYLIGFTTRLISRLEKRMKETMDESVYSLECGSQLPALRSAYDQAQAANDAFVASIGTQLQKSSDTKIDPTKAAFEGFKAGESVSLDTQVGTTANAPKLR